MPTDSTVGPDGRTSCCNAFTIEAPSYILMGAATQRRRNVEVCKACLAEVIRPPQRDEWDE